MLNNVTRARIRQLDNVMVSVYEYNEMNRCKLCVAPVLVGKNRRQLANPASERCRGVLIDLACECRLSARDAKKEFESGYLCRKCFDEIAQYLALQEKVGSLKGELLSKLSPNAGGSTATPPNPIQGTKRTADTVPHGAHAVKVCYYIGI